MADDFQFNTDETLREFLTESWENLAALDNEIVLLEKEPKNADLLASIFRTIHTIKGSCGFVGLEKLGKVSHGAENVLGQMREGVLDVSPPAISIILEAVDCIKELLNHVESSGAEPDVDHSQVIHKLNLLSTLADTERVPQEPIPSEFLPPKPSQNDELVAEIDGLLAASEIDSHPSKNEVDSAVDQASLDATPSNTRLEDRKQNRSQSDLSIRVNVQVLDQLMNLVGELVLTRNQLLQLSRGDDESRYSGPITHLNRVTTDLQEGVMKTRMQPIGHAWGKLPRLVRDLSATTGKQIDLEMSGAETELDRTVLDAIKDPLTHIVRNSADHGIESPADRVLAGKPETGRIHLNAYHEGGHVIIDIEDDGRGINIQRVLEKAIQNGITNEAEARTLSDNEIMRFIFAPGFSTAQQISSVSGRGVGMDVVLTEVEQIGGTVELSSRPGKGAIIRIKIPLTLAIISALIVDCGGELFAIPQLGVVELVRLAAEDKHRIERIHNNQVFRLRDRLLPLVYLNEVLELDLQDQEDDRDIHIVVVQVGDEQFGLIVSEVFDTEEIVVKPLGSLLRDIGVYQGTTILGDGRVVMILDVTGVADQTGGNLAHGTRSESPAESQRDSNAQTTNLLLFDSGSETAMAVPLALVSRLEEFPLDKIEHVGEKLVVQYRGELLPLLSLEGAGQLELSDPQHVLVFSEENRLMGLIVKNILDIVDETLVLRMRSDRPGVLGTAIVNGAATDIVDTRYYITKAHSDWFSRAAEHGPCRVVIVDDSPFFLQLAKTNLEIEGYEIQTFKDAQKAMDALEAGHPCDVLVSDIEMPGIDGFSVAKWAKSQPSLAGTPIILVSSLNNSKIEERSLRAGADCFLQKSNLAQLIRAIEEVFRQSRVQHSEEKLA